jgi:tetratricopeptide (TPR) repeat protein
VVFLALINFTSLVSKGYANAALQALARVSLGADVPALTRVDSESLTPIQNQLERAVAWRPDNHAAYWWLGVVLANQNRMTDAVDAWQSGDVAVEKLASYAEIALQLEENERAITWSRWATQFQPTAGIAWYYLGLAYERLNRWDEALAAFQQGTVHTERQDPILSSLYFHFAQISSQQGRPTDWPTVLAAYDSALTFDRFHYDWERTNAHYGRGEILLRQGRKAAAQQEYEWVVTNAPNHYGAHTRLGVLYWQLSRDAGRAEDALLEAVLLNPEGKWPYVWLGTIYQETGRLAEASAMFKKVIALDPGDNTARRQLDLIDAEGD